jgi:hypothetical protein
MREKMLKRLIDNHTTGSFPNTSIDANDFGLMTVEVMMGKSDKNAIVSAKEMLFHIPLSSDIVKKIKASCTRY